MSMFASGEGWEQQIYLNETWQASRVSLHMPPCAETVYFSELLSLAEQHAEYIGPSLVLDMHSAYLTASTQARLPQE